MTENNVDQFDIKTGQIIKTYRLLNGLSQQQLGQAIQVSFQQVQKYERGTNRVSMSMFERIREILHIPLHKIFENESLAKEVFSLDPVDVQLMSKIAQITDPKKKKAVIDLITSMSHEGA